MIEITSTFLPITTQLGGSLFSPQQSHILSLICYHSTFRIVKDTDVMVPVS